LPALVRVDVLSDAERLFNLGDAPIASTYIPLAGLERTLRPFCARNALTAFTLAAVGE